MLFVIDHEHSAETCPAGTVRPDKEFMNRLESNAKTSGVRVVEGYLDAPAHHFYFIVEADTAEQIVSFATPLINVGKTIVHPVMKWSEAAAMTRKLGLQK
jgi:uncharacterized protein with GYD domain